MTLNKEAVDETRNPELLTNSHLRAIKKSPPLGEESVCLTLTISFCRKPSIAFLLP